MLTLLKNRDWPEQLSVRDADGADPRSSIYVFKANHIISKEAIFHD